MLFRSHPNDGKKPITIFGPDFPFAFDDWIEHPAGLGSRSFHPYIQTDYSEAQLELITSIAHSTKEALRFLGALTDVAGRSIDKSEYLWPLSIPPKLCETDIHIAKLEDDYECYYRKHLADVYGKTLQSMSGIHFNMELGKDLVASLFKESGYQSIIDFKNDIHLKLAQKCIFPSFRKKPVCLYD